MSDPAIGNKDGLCRTACCRTLFGSMEQLLSREWLLTNGLGAYSSSTVIGCPTRRYHGLLVGSLTPPANRILALSNCLEVVEIGKSIEGRMARLVGALIQSIPVEP